MTQEQLAELEALGDAMLIELKEHQRVSYAIASTIAPRITPFVAALREAEQIIDMVIAWGAGRANRTREEDQMILRAKAYRLLKLLGETSK